jgi:hypothetical protein
MAYLVDSDILIQAKNAHYGFDICPGFWSWIEQANQASSVFSVEKVSDELSAGTDDLSVWAQARPPGFFLPVDPAVLVAMSQVSTWVMAQNYQQAAINEFFAAADYYLISAALAHSYTVITSEVPAATVKKIKIPNVCIGLNVAYANVFHMLRTEGASFVLPP